MEYALIILLLVTFLSYFRYDIMSLVAKEKVHTNPYIKIVEQIKSRPVDREESVLFYTRDGYPIYREMVTNCWVVDPYNGLEYRSQIIDISPINYIKEINVSPDYIYLLKSNIPEKIEDRLKKPDSGKEKPYQTL